MERIKAAVLGSTGLVGQHFVRMLERHPWCEIALLTASERSAGRRYGDAVSWEAGGALPLEARELEIAETSVEACLASRVRVAFSALPAEVADGIETQLRDAGVFVFSNASAHRMDAGVPIVIPEINPDHLALACAQRNGKRGFIAANSNCSTAGLALVLAALTRFGIKSVTVSTYQAVSGAGRRGLPAMSILGSAVPFIPGEEEKIEQETRRILGRLDGGTIVDRELDIAASACRIPVREGHLESVVVELESPVTPADVAKALADYRALPQELELPSAPRFPIVVRVEPDRPQPALDILAGEPGSAAGMAVSVGRLRRKGKGVGLFLLVNNLVRGAAGTCVLSFELALKKGYLK